MYKFPDDLRKAYESSPLSFVYFQNVDEKPVPLLVSDGFCRNTGMTRENAMEWMRVGLFERMHPDDVGVVAQISDEFLHKRSNYDVMFRCRITPVDTDPDSEARGEEYTVIHGLGRWQTLPDGAEVAVINYMNISETTGVIREQLTAYELHQRDRFYTDPLTSLPNLNYLHEFGEDKVASIRSDGRTPQLIFSDIYSMQSYNNRYGMEEGDNLIRLTAETLKNRFPGALVTRGADDHFIIITRVDDKDELKKRMIYANDIIRDTASGNTSGIRSGVCQIDPDTGWSGALDHAKHALRRIDNNMNREVAFFSQEADDLYWRDRYIVENLDRAIENGWINVFYQAIRRVESCKTAAYEGLARWNDPYVGRIPPAEFIPVLIKYHLLYKLDLYILEQVCKDFKLRCESGVPPVPVSVNFSRQDFDHADIKAEMDRLYDSCGLGRYVDKSYLIVEITEQDLAIRADRLKEQLKLIRESGYQLWLDDFGSGYSAINMFSRFEFDLIKFDMELMRGLDEHNGMNRIILKELVNVAKKLGLQTLVEGLETQEPLSFVKEIGCDMAQGFYVHKPEPIDDIINIGKACAESFETSEERAAFSEKL